MVGALHAYAIDDAAADPPDPLIAEDRYAILAPFDAVDPAAAGTFYVNVIAVYPAHQGQGVGTKLLSHARAEAAKRGLAKLSLAVFEENRGALDLYQRAGFSEAARSSIVAHECISHGGNLLMMTGPV